MRCSGTRAAQRSARLTMSTGSAKEAVASSSTGKAVHDGVLRKAAAATKALATTSERSITPRLQKFGKRGGLPV